MPADRPLETATPLPPSTSGRTSAPPMRIALIALMISSDRFGEIATLNGFERRFGFGGKLLLDYISRGAEHTRQHLPARFTNNALRRTGSVPFQGADRRQMLLHMHHLATSTDNFELSQI